MNNNIAIVGNWKMNSNRDEALHLVSKIASNLTSDMFSNVDIVVCPPFPYLQPVYDHLSKTSNLSIGLGAQNLALEPISGAYTGEVSAKMLQDVGCDYVIVGHSERRSLYGETDEIVAKKFANALSCNLVPILCVGETLAQRNENLIQEIVKTQLDAVVNLNGVASFAKGIIAYEPIWAIGTGLSATPEQAQAVHSFVRQYLTEQFAITGVKILYGGSLNATNASELLAQPDIDGGLIGGASLKAEEFVKIAKIANSVAS